MLIPRKLLGDCRMTLGSVAENSVQLCVTSPPYHGLRSYLADNHPMKRYEIGSEPTVKAYLENLIEVFGAVRRVLRDDGMLAVNMGDRYTSGGRATYDANKTSVSSACVNQSAGVARPQDPPKLKKKDLCMLPSRFAIAMQEEGGWHLRSQIPWIKRNCMPESVDDRPSSAIEYVYLFSKSEDYFYDPFAVLKVASLNTHPRASVFPHRSLRDDEGGGRRRKPGVNPKAVPMGQGIRANDSYSAAMSDYTSSSRNRRNSDWFLESWQGLLADEFGEPLALVVNPKGTTIKHFASYPAALVEPFVRACTSDGGCCSHCGSPRVRLIERGAPDREHQKACGGDDQGDYLGQATKDYNGAKVQNASDVKRRILAGMAEKKTIGWEATCKCGTRVMPCTVLDPFSGTGCTAMVATALGRASIACELNPEYFKDSDCRDGQGGLTLL